MAISVWNGSSWIRVTTPYVWNGVYWDTILAGRVWNGSSWVDFYPGPYSNEVTEGASGSSLGYIQGQIGSIAPTTTLNGYTVYQWYRITVKSSVFVSFAVVGNYTGTWWTYGTYRGTTFNRANCGIPTGSYDSGTNTTSWAISPSEQPTFTGSGTYTLTIYP